MTLATRCMKILCRSRREVMRSSPVSAALLCVGIWSAASTIHAQEEAPAPAVVDFGAKSLFSADFDLGELNRVEIEEETRYIDRWLSRFYATRLPDWLLPIVREQGLRLPEFMAPVLALGGSPDGDRYLRVRLRGADALLSTRRGPDRFGLEFEPSVRLRWRLLARWDELGEGSWDLKLRLSDGTVLPLFEGQGARPEWTQLAGELILPADAERGDLEICVRGYRAGPRSGEIGLDAIQVETLPRLALEWKDTIARVAPTDEMPILVKSHGLPTSRESYRVEYQIDDASGLTVAHGEQPILVLEGKALEYTPRLSWRRWQLGRGVFTLHVRVRSPRGELLEEQRTFMLAGPAPFARGIGSTEWGVELDGADTAPFWFEAVSPQRVLVRLGSHQVANPNALITWLDRWPEVLVSMVFANADWDETRVAALGDWLTRFRRWYWVDNVTPVEFVAGVRTTAPFVQLGRQLDPGIVASSAEETPLITLRPPERSWHEWRTALARLDSPWDARLDRGVPADARLGSEPGALAASAYVLAAFVPRTVFLVEPARTLFDQRTAGEILPRRSLLAWEFVTSFLSAAEFVGFEDWESDLHALAFNRYGAEYLVVFTDGRLGDLALLAGSGGRAWNELGDEVPLVIDAAERVHIPVGPSPRVVEGLDLPRVRTLRSFALASTGLLRNASEQQLTISMTNHFAQPIRVVPRFELPAGWRAEQAVGPKRCAAGARVEWDLAVHVPSYEGTGEVSKLTGELLLEGDDGMKITLPVQHEIPLSPTVVEIRTLGIGSTDADVAIRNVSGKPIVAHVYLSVRPHGSEVTRLRQTFPPNAELTFQIVYPEARDAAGRKLMVSVSVPSERVYENRVFEIR